MLGLSTHPSSLLSSQQPVTQSHTLVFTWGPGNLHHVPSTGEAGIDNEARMTPKPIPFRLHKAVLIVSYLLLYFADEFHLPEYSRIHIPLGCATHSEFLALSESPFSRE